MQKEVRRPFTFNDALTFKKQVIDAWRPTKDVWSFKHGDDILSTLAVAGSFYTAHYFRKQLKIIPHARLSCYAPILVFPALSVVVFQSFIISTDIIQRNACPLCITTKATLLQGIIGFGLPLILAPTVCFYLADRFMFYPVPPLLKAPREVFGLFQKLLQRNPRPFIVIGAVNILAGFFITQQKQKSFNKITSEMNIK